ncbi:DNA-binding transcriptional LysR family regulator [Sinorhizobium kostiense]|uniref:DNA-binding transcriptional LysR family regulator n=1 Tax=Sinorhizobium kostiense TaxID=76747 RepID=A0ABS4R7F7_9HYPH|nr:LysR substrate-binding domain-containing protein [Sinorhizobium kostiense]MBP2238835.1 DNA-binding transcriptional LysR family regulator [Sinorhizobium kostiense]
MTRYDLNDFVYFAEVVAHGGFAAAGRALREPKSKLSRRIAGLEARLGVRLIERSSRRFRVTDVGQSFYERCKALVAEAERAEALVAEAQSEPHGLIRMSCPTGLVESITGLLNQFLERHPKVRLQLIAIDRPVDLIEERIDVALRVRTSLDGDASLTMRSLGSSVRILVASPQIASGITGIDDLGNHPTLASNDELGDVDWHLEIEDGQRHILNHAPRMSCADFTAVRAAAVAGLGVALLPDHNCRQALDEGKLVRVLPPWRGVRGLVHLVFTTRRGLPPAVRKFIDCLAAGFPEDALAR